METVKVKTAEEILSAFQSHPDDKDLFHRAYIISAMQSYASIQTSELKAEITALNEDVRLLKESGSAKIKQYTELKAENERYREALKKIHNPIDELRKDAEMSGAKLNGLIAIHLSNDANYLKSIAYSVLNP